MAPMSGHLTACELSQLGMTQQCSHVARETQQAIAHALHCTTLELCQHAFSPISHCPFFMTLPMSFPGVLSFMHRVHIIFITLILLNKTINLDPLFPR